ncbi:hypothetical protein PENSPDRAFT_732321 [Peniophora sp. CONT]|nr:hypothetical protein PENSPDRAFT_732321 [Peniophora sp. CONT]
MDAGGTDVCDQPADVSESFDAHGETGQLTALDGLSLSQLGLSIFDPQNEVDDCKIIPGLDSALTSPRAYRDRFSAGPDTTSPPYENYEYTPRLEAAEPNLSLGIDAADVHRVPRVRFAETVCYIPTPEIPELIPWLTMCAFNPACSSLYAIGITAVHASHKHTVTPGTTARQILHEPVSEIASLKDVHRLLRKLRKLTDRLRGLSIGYSGKNWERSNLDHPVQNVRHFFFPDLTHFNMSDRWDVFNYILPHILLPTGLHRLHLHVSELDPESSSRICNPSDVDVGQFFDWLRRYARACAATLSRHKIAMAFSTQRWCFLDAAPNVPVTRTEFAVWLDPGELLPRWTFVHDATAQERADDFAMSLLETIAEQLGRGRVIKRPEVPSELSIGVCYDDHSLHSSALPHLLSGYDNPTLSASTQAEKEMPTAPQRRILELPL